MVEWWASYFKACADVQVSRGDIFEDSADAIISPANSFGFMDGGIDLVYLRRFGHELQERLQALLLAQHDGELPVGQAVVIETGDQAIPFLISAPTMRVPMDVSDTVNAYLAFRAAIRAVRRHNAMAQSPIRSVLSPGLCTAVGRMPFERCARQMHAAYVICALGQVIQHPRLGSAVDAHHHLLS
jgi:O-acetyl-ADP-ribose deacetylase (regulator of RNase III)